MYNSSSVDISLLVSPSTAALAAVAAAGAPGMPGTPWAPGVSGAQGAAAPAVPATAEAAPGAGAAPLPDGVDLALRVVVKSPDRGEHRSLAGMGSAASDAWDPLDLHEPPAIGDYTRGVFQFEGWLFRIP